MEEGEFSEAREDLAALGTILANIYHLRLQNFNLQNFWKAQFPSSNILADANLRHNKIQF